MHYREQGRQSLKFCLDKINVAGEGEFLMTEVIVSDGISAVVKLKVLVHNSKGCSAGKESDLGQNLVCLVSYY